MTQLAVALLFPSDVTRAIDEARKRFGSTRARSVVPHITLVYPFVPVVSVGTIAERLIDVAKRTAPFVIALNRFGYFEEPVRLIYLGVSNETEIARLHRAVSDALCVMSQSKIAHFDDRDFVPHISINDDVTGDQLPGIIKQLDLLHLDLRAKIDRFCLFQDEGDGWKTSQTIDFASR